MQQEDSASLSAGDRTASMSADNRPSEAQLIEEIEKCVNDGDADALQVCLTVFFQ